MSDELGKLTPCVNEKCDRMAVALYCCIGCQINTGAWHTDDEAVHSLYCHDREQRRLASIQQAAVVQAQEASPEGVWFVYGIDTMPYPIMVNKDEVDARRFANELGYFVYVKFWPFGVKFDEIDFEEGR